MLLARRVARIPWLSRSASCPRVEWSRIVGFLFECIWLTIPSYLPASDSNLLLFETRNLDKIFFVSMTRKTRLVFGCSTHEIFLQDYTLTVKTVVLRSVILPKVANLYYNEIDTSRYIAIVVV